jgi:hypothetical protein
MAKSSSNSLFAQGGLARLIVWIASWLCIERRAVQANYSCDMPFSIHGKWFSVINPS